jgi:hypothetical protein
VEWLKVKALSSSPSTAKKKKKEEEEERIVTGRQDQFNLQKSINIMHYNKGQKSYEYLNRSRKDI